MHCGDRTMPRTRVYGRHLAIPGPPLMPTAQHFIRPQRPQNGPAHRPPPDKHFPSIHSASIPFHALVRPCFGAREIATSSRCVAKAAKPPKTPTAALSDDQSTHLELATAATRPHRRANYTSWVPYDSEPPIYADGYQV